MPRPVGGENNAACLPAAPDNGLKDTGTSIFCQLVLLCGFWRGAASFENRPFGVLPDGKLPSISARIRVRRLHPRQIDDLEGDSGATMGTPATTTHAQRVRASQPGYRVTDAQAVVYVIDDDPSVRDALGSLVRSVGLEVKVFGSTQEFLESPRPDVPGCLVLDVRLPGAGGLDLQSQLLKSNIHLPIVFITGHGDIPMSVQAMKAGAIEFLTKPFRDQELLDAIQVGIERDRARRRNSEIVRQLRERFESLTVREQEIMAHVVTGRMNKQIAGDLDVSEITVKVHRGQVMRKMGAKSLAELVRMADKLGISRT
jgi:FixJ family two-component response regulator